METCGVPRMMLGKQPGSSFLRQPKDAQLMQCEILITFIRLHSNTPSYLLYVSL